MVVERLFVTRPHATAADGRELVKVARGNGSRFEEEGRKKNRGARN